FDMAAAADLLKPARFRPSYILGRLIDAYFLPGTSDSFRRFGAHAAILSRRAAFARASETVDCRYRSPHRASRSNTLKSPSVNRRAPAMSVCFSNRAAIPLGFVPSEIPRMSSRLIACADSSPHWLNHSDSGLPSLSRPTIASTAPVLTRLQAVERDAATAGDA